MIWGRTINCCPYFESESLQEQILVLGSDSNSHHLKYNELNPLTVGMYIWPEQENGDSI